MYPTLTDASLGRLAKLGGDPFELEVLYAVASQPVVLLEYSARSGWVGGSLINIWFGQENRIDIYQPSNVAGPSQPRAVLRGSSPRNRFHNVPGHA